MKRFVIKAIITILAKAILLTTIVAVIIAILGYINKWDSSITYSNAFFLAGCLVIIAGTSARFASGQEWMNFQLLNAESFRAMSSSERVNYIISVSSPLSTVILALLSGISLIAISAIAAYLF